MGNIPWLTSPQETGDQIIITAQEQLVPKLRRERKCKKDKPVSITTTAFF